MRRVRADSGPSSAGVTPSLLTGWLPQPAQGSWCSARAQHGQRHHGETIFAYDFLTVETVMIAPLDMKHLNWRMAERSRCSPYLGWLVSSGSSRAASVTMQRCRSASGSRACVGTG